MYNSADFWELICVFLCVSLCGYVCLLRDLWEIDADLTLRPLFSKSRFFVFLCVDMCVSKKSVEGRCRRPLFSKILFFLVSLDPLRDLWEISQLSMRKIRSGLYSEKSFTWWVLYSEYTRALTVKNLCQATVWTWVTRAWGSWARAQGQKEY